MTRTDEFVTVDGTELHYSAWGDPDDPVVVCVHGLSRNGRDFDPLASELADDYRVLCPDMPGRGLSEWADDPDTGYTWPALRDTVLGFCDALDLDEFRYVGTSMGALLGITLASTALDGRVTHLVCNDIGPVLTQADDGVDRIESYLTNPPVCETVTDLEDWYRETYATSNEKTDAQWRRFTLTSMRRRDDGLVTRDYDERIVTPLLRGEDDVSDAEAWRRWESLECPVFVVWGRESDILHEATVEEMLERRPETEVLELDCGHPPGLNVAAQIAPIRRFLAG
ncbi:alpha/beta fold hydrolase [Haloarchaeobius amylolyticus]|uniref:alpha/beta fold hydrolase n=1 Tax=Haloarchaeobius amylolyticus TaxID=1198296 RepID=UPI00226F7D12|nr:alpha/beta hydrolase [Haloarchaeobius amylolyticus]